MENSQNNKKFTFNWPLVGNRQITDFLEKSIINGKVAGTYIFHGPDNLGKAAAAVYFARSLLCRKHQEGGGSLPCGDCLSCRLFQVNAEKQKGVIDQVEAGNAHGDCHVIRREKDKKNIPVESVREFIRILGMSSFLNSYKIGIIKDAECLSQEAANALLKTLEEPKDKVIIILVTHDLDSLLPTIMSRGQMLGFCSVAAGVIYDYLIKEHQASRSAAKNFSRLCLGRPALAVKFLEDREYCERYERQVKIFLSFADQDINQRFMALGDLAGPKIAGQEAVRDVKRILEAWQGIVRDWLLLEYGFNDLAQHQIAEDDPAKLKNRLPLNKIIALYRSLRRAEAYLAANVNPRLVLEDVAVGV